MPQPTKTRLICNCEGSMTIDAQTLGGQGNSAHHLCRSQLDHFRKALGDFAEVTVACTQESPLFAEVAEDMDYQGTLHFANIRETAGWSEEGQSAAPKMAALLAMAELAATSFDIVSLESNGIALILGRDQAALDVAQNLSDTLDITVLLTPGADVAPRAQTTWPVLQGRIRRASGHLGSFELTVDDYAAPLPSSRTRLVFDAARNGAISTCDLVIDLTGGQPLFHETRPGYFSDDPRDPVALAKLVTAASQMVGTFDKPKYINFTPDLCAHSRNTLTGCARCLNLCPTGAITSFGDTVAIDPNICAGCGQCAAACPTGAAAYALPVVDNIAARLRVGLAAYFAAGGKDAPVLLFHDAGHGSALIDASARFGRGLPAHVIPLQINEPTQIGPEIMAAALAYGANGVRVLAKERPAHPLDGLQETLDLMAVICGEAGHDPAACALLSIDDPDALDAALWQPATPARAKRSGFLPPDDKRGLLLLAMEELNRTAPTPTDFIPLEHGAPFGSVTLDHDACTLCLACVGACPAGALSDNADMPMLRFTESACVQCAICVATCPEDALSLTPQIDFAAWAAPRRVLKQEDPFACTSCAKPFGTKSSIDRVMQKLEGHWMFAGNAGADRRRLLTMCDDCRTREVVIAGFDPHEKVGG
ncbi:MULTISPECIES: 4Fe-4S dicluster domain-containing protein [unclassified Yoonia]|uniref:4Fe-4S dicluster domain-containing protein n=1 Tax=unclassified Yoonia TaxID=2629118 RepID=UPI002B0032C7|nr:MULTISPECIES: 4Fe-4S dicluster domain-containing protein [unclassified Yoonia]